MWAYKVAYGNCWGTGTNQFQTIQMIPILHWELWMIFSFFSIDDKFYFIRMISDCSKSFNVLWMLSNFDILKVQTSQKFQQAHGSSRTILHTIVFSQRHPLVKTGLFERKKGHVYVSHENKSFHFLRKSAHSSFTCLRIFRNSVGSHFWKKAPLSLNWFSKIK